MTVELADIHVEDLKPGYIIHGIEQHPCKVLAPNPYEYQNSMTGEWMVDVYVTPMVASVIVDPDCCQWLTFGRGEIVQVEA